MQVSDSLDENMSFFYAELQRIRKVLDAVLAGDPVLFIIDEMLKGTNALDRQAGSIALVRQLIENKAGGLIGTHDLELARLSEEYPGELRNVHFDGFVEDDRLLFDYKLKDGVCDSSNSLALMRKIGIRI
jgi:DNA mismatch repair ATPase MutS